MINDLIQQGLQHHNAGRIEEAKLLYEQALAVNPKHPDALHLLGLTALQSGSPGRAAELIRAAIAGQRKNPAFHANLAAALTELGEWDDALAAFRSAAKLDPREPQFQVGIANCNALSGKYREAEIQLRKITQRFPRCALAWLNLGNAVRDQGRADEALQFYRRAIEVDANLLDAHNNLGNALRSLGWFEDAEQAYRRAIALQPDYELGLSNLANVLIDRARFAEAEAVCRNALARAPQSALLYSFLAAAIGHQGRLHEALDLHRKAAALAPESAHTLTALGSALYEIGMLAEGLPLLARAVTLAPHSWEAHFWLAIAKLAAGEFDEGWREFIHRPTRGHFIKLNPEVKLAASLPEALAERTVCVLGEQGLGDQLFFLRFAGHLKARGASVTYRSTPKITSILERVATLDQVLPDTAPIPQAEHTLLVSDLPLALSSPAALPEARGKIAPPVPPPLALTPLADQLALIRNRLSALGPPPYFGLTWRGGTSPDAQSGMSWMLFKQIPLQQLSATLRGIAGTFLALQRHPEPGEIEHLSACIGKPVHDLTALNEDLEAMLALLALIDDYIGVSNTNMHLRAGVGKTARVLVPCPAEWRWMSAGEESLWFPGFRIYRQTSHGDWDGALKKLSGDLLEPS